MIIKSIYIYVYTYTYMYTYSVAAGAEDHCSMLHNVEKCSAGETFPQCTERFVFD